MGDRTLILIGFEGPDLRDPRDPRKRFWHPTASDHNWRFLVKRAVCEFLERSQDEWRWKLPPDSPVQSFKNSVDLTRALSKGRYDRIVIYSHGYPGGLMAIIDKQENHVGPYDLAKVIAEAGVRSALLLGCNSKELAETVARLAGGIIRVGGIEPIRDDAVDRRKSRLDILNAIIWGYGGKQ